MKKFKGFTLIELIVVIAIIGVLCAILVPSMMGWVTKSRVNSANSNAKSIYNSAASVLTSFETQGLKADGTKADGTIDLDEDYESPTEVPEDTDVSLVAEISRMEDTSSKSAKWAIRVENNYVTAAIYSSNGSNYLGAFPNAVPEKEKVDYSKDALNKAVKTADADDWKTSTAG